MGVGRPLSAACNRKCTSMILIWNKAFELGNRTQAFFCMCKLRIPEVIACPSHIPPSESSAISHAVDCPQPPGLWCNYSPWLAKQADSQEGTLPKGGRMLFLFAPRKHIFF